MLQISVLIVEDLETLIYGAFCLLIGLFQGKNHYASTRIIHDQSKRNLQVLK